MEVESGTVADDQKQNIIKTVNDYGGRLFCFIRGNVKTNEDAEDILQDVWLQLSKSADATKIEQMSGWLHKVARNKITDSYRKKTIESLEELNYTGEDGETNFSDFPADFLAPEREQLHEIFWEELNDALEELPESQRQVFVWNELEELTLQEIADQTGENLKTIISRKGYAIKFLRYRLGELYNEFMDN